MSPHLKIHVCWKEVLHLPRKLYWHSKRIILVYCNWAKLITDSTTEHKQYLKDVSLRTARYSWRLSTVGTALLFTQSVNNTNITVHILQYITVMNQDTLQLFPPGSTSTPLSHTRLHLTKCLFWLKVAPVLMYWDICMYIGYQQFVFWYLMEERLEFIFISLL